MELHLHFPICLQGVVIQHGTPFSIIIIIIITVYFFNMTVKHNNLLNLIIGCLYVSFFGLHVSVILMTIIRFVRAKEIAMQQRFSLNVMGSHYVLHCSV